MALKPDGLTLNEAEAEARRALFALVEHFCFSREGLRRVADEAYAEWEAERA